MNRLLVLFLLVLPLAAAIKFSVEPNKMRCISEFVIHDDVLVVGQYNIEPREGQEMEVKVTDPQQRMIFNRRNTESGKFAFTSTMPGEHQICFISTVYKPFGSSRNRIPPQPREVDCTLKMGVDANDYSELALREHLDPLDKELKRTLDRAKEITSDFGYLHIRGKKHRATDESTNARVMWYSMFCIGGFFALNVWQSLYLKKFFREKKLI